MLNSVNLQGRLAESPELRYTQGGVPVVRFGLAVEGTSKDAPADFFTIVCWREQAHDEQVDGQERLQAQRRGSHSPPGALRREQGAAGARLPDTAAEL